MRNKGSAVANMSTIKSQDIFIFSRDFNFSYIPPCVPGRTKVDNLLLSSGYYYGSLIDITDSMNQIHQGGSNYHQSFFQGNKDSLYNLQFLKRSVKLCNSQFQVIKQNISFILKRNLMNNSSSL